MIESLKKIIFVNTLANYGLSITRFFTQIILTRILFLNLGEVSYGFWALLWSIFGYSLLLDFGFGTSVQKYSAEVTVTKDYQKYNHQISTVITSYTAMSFIIILATLVMSQFLDKLFIFPEGVYTEYYRKVFIFFGVGAAISFPSGAFTEILRGLNKIYLRNIIYFANILINFGGIVLIFKLGCGLLELTVFSISLNICTNIVMAVFCKKLLPKMTISPFYFQWHMLKEVVGFSLFAYLIMFANIIIFKTDQIVLGIMLGVTAVTVYQVSSRTANVLLQFTHQFQESLTPIAAALHKDGQKQRLQRILFDSNRIIAVITTLLFIILTSLAKPILLVWLEIDPTNPQFSENYMDIIRIVYIMNVSIYLLLLFRSGSSKVLLMTGFHKFLSYVAIAESVMNISFSIIFIKLIGVVGVAIGTLIPNVILGIFVIFPKAAKFSEISITKNLVKIYFPLMISCLPSLIFVAFINHTIPLLEWKLTTLVWVAVVIALLYLSTAWIVMLSKNERETVINKIKEFKKRA